MAAALVVAELDVGDPRVVVDDRVGEVVAHLRSGAIQSRLRWERSPVTAWPGRSKRVPQYPCAAGRRDRDTRSGWAAPSGRARAGRGRGGGAPSRPSSADDRWRRPPPVGPQPVGRRASQMCSWWAFSSRLGRLERSKLQAPERSSAGVAPRRRPHQRWAVAGDTQKAAGCRLPRHSRRDRLGQRETASWSELGSWVRRHPGHPLGSESWQTHSLWRGPDGVGVDPLSLTP